MQREKKSARNDFALCLSTELVNLPKLHPLIIIMYCFVLTLAHCEVTQAKVQACFVAHLYGCQVIKQQLFILMEQLLHKCPK
jgi:hypothetical protein